MVTKNRRVAAYLPPHVDERFQEFKKKADIKGDSEAFIKIIMEYLGVEHPVTQKVSFTQFSELVQRLEVLEGKEFVTQGHLDELKSEVNKNIALSMATQLENKSKKSKAPEKPIQDSELEGSSGNGPLQLGIVQNSEKKGGSESFRSDGINGIKMAERLGVSRPSLSAHKRKGPKYFSQWSADKDPEGLAWQYDEDKKLYYLNF